jgi:hypothetical protein
MVDILKHLSSLNSCTLVTTGRTGSDFFQSLLDSHPEVLTFNGNIIDYYDFWNNSKCVKTDGFDLSDFIWEFIGTYIERFKSKYDYFERKDQLGENFDQSIDIDIHKFRKYFIDIMNGNVVNEKNCLLAIYGAYAIVLGQDIFKKKIFFHHIHHHEKLASFIKDFPATKIISMTRDPRANITSGVYNHKKYNPESMNGAHQYFYINRILKDARALEIYNNEFISIKLESLGRENTLRQLAIWLGIEYSEKLKISTWAGLIWNGDRLSQQKRRGVGFSKELLANNWEDILSKKDKYIFNFLMNKRLEHYNYNFKKINVISYLLIPFLNIMPLSYEKEMLSIPFIFKETMKKNPKLIILNYYYYIKRIILFQKYYWKTINNESFNLPYLG